MILTNNKQGLEQKTLKPVTLTCQKKMILLQRNTMQGKWGSWHSCGCYTDVYLLPKHYCRPSTTDHKKIGEEENLKTRKQTKEDNVSSEEGLKLKSLY